MLDSSLSFLFFLKTESSSDTVVTSLQKVDSVFKLSVWGISNPSQRFEYLIPTRTTKIPASFVKKLTRAFTIRRVRMERFLLDVQLYPRFIYRLTRDYQPHLHQPVLVPLHVSAVKVSVTSAQGARHAVYPTPEGIGSAGVQYPHRKAFCAVTPRTIPSFVSAFGACARGQSPTTLERGLVSLILAKNLAPRPVQVKGLRGSSRSATLLSVPVLSDK